MKKTFLRQTTVKLTRTNQSEKQIKVSIPQYTNSNLLHRKYTRSISSFNNIPTVNDNLERKNSASHRKMSKGKLSQDPLKSMQNMFVQGIRATSEEQILRDIYYRFSCCESLAQESKEIRLENLFQKMKVYLGGMLKILLQIEENRIRMMTNKLIILASSYEKRMAQHKTEVLQKLKREGTSKSSELGKKIEQLTFRTTFTNVILNEFSKSGIDIDEMIRQSQFMKNYTSGFEEVDFKEGQKSDGFGDLGELGQNQFMISDKSSSMHSVGRLPRS